MISIVVIQRFKGLLRPLVSAGVGLSLLAGLAACSLLPGGAGQDAQSQALKQTQIAMAVEATALALSQANQQPAAQPAADPLQQTMAAQQALSAALKATQDALAAMQQQAAAVQSTATPLPPTPLPPAPPPAQDPAVVALKATLAALQTGVPPAVSPTAAAGDANSVAALNATVQAMLAAQAGRGQVPKLLGSSTTPTTTVQGPPAPVLKDITFSGCEVRQVYVWVGGYYRDAWDPHEQGSFNLSWLPVAYNNEEITYHYEVESDSTNPPFRVVSKGNTTKPQIYVNLSCSYTYHWRVQAITKSGVTGPFSAFGNFQARAR